MLAKPITDETIDHAVDLVLEGDVRPWPFPDEYMEIFNKWADHPDPARADEIKRLGHESLAYKAIIDSICDSAPSLEAAKKVLFALPDWKPGMPLPANPFT